MSAKQKEKQIATPEKQESRDQEVAIGNRVLHALGQPDNFLRVQVRRLWGDHYRVNVFVGDDAASARVAHSYFLTTGSEGNFAACSPEISKQYHPAVKVAEVATQS
jgi:hypothetical protein